MFSVKGVNFKKQNMQSKKRLVNKVILTSLLLTVIIGFTNCKKSESELLSPSDSLITDTNIISALPTTKGVVLNLSSSLFKSDGGFAYRLKETIAGGDTDQAPQQSALKLYEDGIALVQAHSLHDDIRNIGKGRYSHWGTTVIFSASDNTDPRTNGKKYTYVIGNTSGVVETSKGATNIDLTTGKLDAGFAFRVPIDPNIISDSGNQPSISTLKVYENGVEIGPAHSQHADVRNIGKGRFSHWTGYLYFSASDNSNPLTNGRKYTYTVGSEPSTPSNNITAPITNPVSTDASQAILGYATMNGMTTGGQGGSVVTVTSLSALKSALQGDDSPKIVYVSGAIKGAGADPIYLKSNKSIIGLSGASIEGASFQLVGSGVSNVIIQNLKMSNYLTYGAVTVTEGAHHVWIDHCEFSTDRNHGYEYYSKDIIVARGSDYVTISWNKFHDQVLSVLISSGINAKSEASDVGKLRVTLHHNYWYNISEREPTMNYGSVHMFNNYHLNNNGYSIGARAGGNVRTDNEYFANCKMPISTSLAGDPPGYITGANTNVYVNCEANNITTTAGNWAPNYEYKAALNAAQDVPAIVTKGAGPK